MNVSLVKFVLHIPGSESYGGQIYPCLVDLSSKYFVEAMSTHSSTSLMHSATCFQLIVLGCDLPCIPNFSTV